MSVTWDGTRADRPCRRCGHPAVAHDHHTSSTSCVRCDCPAFTGTFAWLIHLITGRWP